jgi:hypothetical protein
MKPLWKSQKGKLSLTFFSGSSEKSNGNVWAARELDTTLPAHFEVLLPLQAVKEIREQGGNNFRIQVKARFVAENNKIQPLMMIETQTGDAGRGIWVPDALFSEIKAGSVVNLGTIHMTRTYLPKQIQSCSGDWTVTGTVHPSEAFKKQYANAKFAVVGIPETIPFLQPVSPDQLSQKAMFYGPLDFSRGTATFSFKAHLIPSPLPYFMIVASECKPNEDLKQCAAAAFPWAPRTNERGHFHIKPKEFTALMCDETNLELYIHNGRLSHEPLPEKENLPANWIAPQELTPHDW